MEEKLSVLCVKAREKPKRIEIEGDLGALQQAVGGYIEAVYPYEDPVALIVNEEGKLNVLPLNRALRDEDNKIYDTKTYKGLTYQREYAGKQYDEVKLSIPNVVKEYERLIAQKRFPGEDAVAKIPDYERRQLARAVYHGFSNAPEHIPRPYPLNTDFYGAVPVTEAQLQDTSKAKAMRDALTAWLEELDAGDRNYASAERAKEQLSQYINGTFSLFDNRHDQELSEQAEAPAEEPAPTEPAQEEESPAPPVLTPPKKETERLMADAPLDAQGVNYRIADDALGAAPPSQRYAVITNATALPAISFETSNFKPVAGQTYTVYASFPIVTVDGGKQLGSASVIATIKAVEKQKTVITSVKLTGDALKEGDAAGPTLTGSDTGYTVRTVTPWNITGSAAAGKEYYTNLFVEAADGYVFPTDWDQLRSIISVKLGNTPVRKLGISLTEDAKTLVLAVYTIADHVHSWSEWKHDEDYHYKECTVCKAVSDKIPHSWSNWTNNDEDTQKRTCSDCGYSETRAKPERPISFLKINIIRPVAGAASSASDLTIRDAYTEQVEIVPNSVGWYDESGNPVTGNFEKGKSYTIKAQFRPIGERTFADTITTAGLFFTDGETKNLSTDKKIVEYSCTFKAYESVTVDTALPTLKAGEAMPLPTVAEGRTYDTVNVLYSAGAGSLASLSYDGSKWQINGADATEEDIKVKADTVYAYSYTINEGDDEKVTANLTGAGNSVTSDAAGNWVIASYTINAEDKIISVDLTVAAPEYGKAPATNATGADNTKYTVGAPAWSPAVTDNKFGAGTYTVSIPVTVAAGYSFAEGCIYTVNGYKAEYDATTGKVSYTFPALTAPHTHTPDTWTPLDDTNHYRTCTTCGEGMEIEEHTFGDWQQGDETRHYKECSVCHHKVYGSHEESARITDAAAGIGTAGAWHTECEVCHKTMNSGTIAALEKIDKAEVTVTAPVRNAAPTNAAVKDTETRYYVADTEWTPDVTDKFASGTKYTVKVTLEANNGYAFKGDGIFGIGDTTFYINGKKAKVVSGDAQQVVITYEFPSTGSGSYSGGTGSGGTTTNKPVKSARTGDPGVMLYAAMGLLSLTGGAWVVGKKRKDK